MITFFLVRREGYTVRKESMGKWALGQPDWGSSLCFDIFTWLGQIILFKPIDIFQLLIV